MIFTPYYDIVRWRTQDLSYERSTPTGRSGGSRIFPGGGGANSQSGCTNLFLSEKLHENERIWTPKGCESLAPSLDPPLEGINSIFCIISQKYHGIKENLVRKVRPGAPH